VHVEPCAQDVRYAATGYQFSICRQKVLSNPPQSDRRLLLLLPVDKLQLGNTCRFGDIVSLKQQIEKLVARSERSKSEHERLEE
jgi:hypothetical protein